MKTSIIVLSALLIATIAGCPRASTRGGRLTNGEQGFRLVVPRTAQELRQGERTTVRIELLRDRYFRDDIQIQVQATEGIQIQPQEIMVTGDLRPEVDVWVQAPMDAALGDYRVLVTATPREGTATSTEFIIRVVSAIAPN